MSAPAEAFWVQMKVGLIVGIFLAAPAILWQVWAFVAPGLHQQEKKYALPFVVIGSLLFIGGGAFSLFVVTPYAIQFLLSYARPGLKPMIMHRLRVASLSCKGAGLSMGSGVRLWLLVFVGRWDGELNDLTSSANSPAVKGG